MYAKFRHIRRNVNEIKNQTALFDGVFRKYLFYTKKREEEMENRIGRLLLESGSVDIEIYSLNCDLKKKFESKEYKRVYSESDPYGEEIWDE
jgi:hypothetical protein